ncbi:hypothetical protein KR054_004497, partial [Drosophila jambulina]
MLRAIHIGHLPPVRSLASFGSRFSYQSLPKPPHRYENYYQVLNVPVCSSDQEIKSAFIELSKKYHPDANTQTRDSEVFIKICEAYKTLHRQNTRQQYDSRLRMERQGVTSHSDTAFSSRQMSTRWSQYQSAMRNKQKSRSSQTFPKAKSIIFKYKAPRKYLPMTIDLHHPWALAVEATSEDEDGGGDGYEEESKKSWEDYFPFIFYLYVVGLCGVGGLGTMDLV